MIVSIKKSTTNTENELSSMCLNSGYDVGVPYSSIRLLILLALLVAAETLQAQETHLKPRVNRRLDITPRDAITHSSAIDCAVTCRLTSWCVAANLLPDGSTCQLLTEEVPDDHESLLPADAWTYIRKYAALYRIQDL